MNIFKIIASISIILLMLISNVALVVADGNSTDYPKTVIDGANRTITITEPIERVVALTSDISEALKILGVEDKTIAVTDSIQKKTALFPNLKRPELANVSAVKNDKIFIIAAISGGPKVFVCTLYMAKWFHPDLFEDLNPEAVHQEYLSRFLRLNYDLHEHGVFVYPPLEVS